jgi:protein-S-isoprenylcysteine O-methyltransferase Ste14
MGAIAMTPAAGEDRGPGVAVARPPRVHLGALVLGAGLGWLWPSSLVAAGLPGALRWPVGAGLLALGLGLMTGAVRGFGRAGTPVETCRPATALVTEGLYGWSRNPMYVALALLHAGIAVLADSAWMLLVLAPLLVWIRVGVVAREERHLLARFGPAYAAYRARVRRWL